MAKKKSGAGGKAVVTFEDTPNGQVHVTVDFSPAISVKDDLVTPAQMYAIGVLEAAKRFSETTDEDTEDE